MLNLPGRDDDALRYLEALETACAVLDWGTDPEEILEARDGLKALAPQHGLVAALDVKLRRARDLRWLALAGERPGLGAAP